jgi:hypothetical protein
MRCRGGALTTFDDKLPVIAPQVQNLILRGGLPQEDPIGLGDEMFDLFRKVVFGKRTEENFALFLGDRMITARK